MLLGLDIGTQSVKALIVDRKLAPLGSGSCKLQYQVMTGNRAEQRPEDWLKGLLPAIEAALAGAKIQAREILAIGVAGQLDGCIPADRENVPLHPCLTWMDRRASACIQHVTSEVILQQCGVVKDASHMAAKIAWFKHELPAIYEAAEIFHQPVSYVVAGLTGAKVIDRTLASTTMLYDLRARAFSKDLCKLFEISAAKLPALASMSEVAGRLSNQGSRLTGIPAGIPVAVGTGDDFSNAIGAGIFKPGALLCQIGTGEVVGTLHAEPAIDHGRLVETHEFFGNLYWLENPGWLSGGAVEWIRKLLRISNLEEFNSIAEKAPPGAGGVTFFPALAGAMAPEWNANVRACFHNLGPDHDASHLARSVLEGTGFAMRDVQLRLEAMGISCDQITLAGGGASSDLWAKIRADISGLPVYRTKNREASTLGAAILAAVASGVIPHIAAAEELMDPPEGPIDPAPVHHALYCEAHKRYLNLYAALKDINSSA